MWNGIVGDTEHAGWDDNFDDDNWATLDDDLVWDDDDDSDEDEEDE